MSPARLVAILSTVPEHRSARTRAHKLVDILVIALLAMINGAAGWEDMAEFADARVAWLRTFLELAGGAPCADTFRRVFEAMDVQAFARALQQITEGLVSDLKDRAVAIDGKTMRGSSDRRSGLGPLHVVTAWATDLNLTLGQIATEEKSNEITAIPELLKTIDVTGATVTIDAMGCQKKLATAIVEGGADYLLALKDNHPTLREEVAIAFAEMDANGAPKGTTRTVSKVENKGHGRRELRRVTVSDNVSWLTDFAEWTNLRSIVCVERARTVGDQTSHETAYYLSSSTRQADVLQRFIRSHWSIENTLHWTLDVTFQEDRSRIRSRTGALNLAHVRKLALSLLKLEQSKPGRSIAMKRKRAGWEPDYALRVLSMISGG